MAALLRQALRGAARAPAAPRTLRSVAARRDGFCPAKTTQCGCARRKAASVSVVGALAPESLTSLTVSHIAT